MIRLKLLFASYVGVLVALFFYSFTQVDLSLTLSRLSIYQILEKNFQYVGFFQRPFSAAIFSVIVFFLFVFYFLFLFLTKKRQLEIKYLKIIIFLIFIVLVFSYNAFSYDLFNYIFDAKILTHYGLNPYLHKASDFTNDPMLNFMRWTHRDYPYGPSWLLLTVPLSYIGMNIFLPTFFLFKFLMGLSFLGSCYLVYKISEILFPENKLLNLSFWAFNPLVIIESLVSAHNDISMIFLMLLSVYLFLQRKKTLSLLSYLFSVGVKFSTGVFLPVAVYLIAINKLKKKIDWEKIFVISFFLALATIFVAAIRTTFQPWYLLFPLSVASFIPKKYYIFIPSLIGTIFALSIYVPYVLLTDYAKSYPSIVLNIAIAGLISALLLTFLLFLKVKLLKH
ncbi:MAG: hypothetical protein M1405_01725 [Patescibacteria group bacterium]|nr:hypothetical protein [Patescibacteria group bacterium]